MMKRKNSKGITLIALVITIIVLLILAGVSIATLMGEGGILSKATKAKTNTEEAQIIEEVNLAVTEIRMEELHEGKKFSNKEFSEQLSDKLEGVVIGEITDEKIKIEYKDYELEIDNGRNVETLGKTKIKVNYTLEPTEGWTNEAVIIQIEITSEDDLSVLSFIPTGENVEIVEENKKFKVTENGLYRFQLTDNTHAKKEIIIPIQKIDKVDPIVKIEVTNQNNFINGKIKAKVTITDSESGIDVQKCKWILNQNSGAIGTDETAYTGTIASQNDKIEEQEIETAAIPTAGKYYLHVLATDQTGNAIEKISSEIEVKSGYAISTPTDLQNMKNNLSANYYVVNDIDMTGFYFSRIAGEFNGSLDGQGYTISNYSSSRTYF